MIDGIRSQPFRLGNIRLTMKAKALLIALLFVPFAAPPAAAKGGWPMFTVPTWVPMCCAVW